MRPELTLLHRARAYPAGWLAAGLLAAGWVVAAFVWWGSWAVAISAAACWLVTTLFLLAAWELVLLLGLGPGIQVLHRETALAALRPWLIPAAVVVGLLFGHYLWD
jgi:hypothetical protein